MSLMHTPPAGRELLEVTVSAVAARSEAAPTPVLQYAGLLGERLQVGTLFEDRDQMADMFTSYTLPEGQQAMVEKGTPVDLTREELEIDHIVIEDVVEAVPFDFSPAGTVVASISRGGAFSPETYWERIDQEGWFLQPVEGRLVHFAFLSEGAIRVVDIWSDIETGRRRFAAEFGGVFEVDWIALDHFMVGAARGSRARRFERRTPGKIPV
jgi:hypothetical protein